jgi:hypothetical protein
VKSLKPFVAIVEYLRRELTWGKTSSPDKSPREKEKISALQPAAVELGRAVISAMEVVERCVHMTYNSRLSHQPELTGEERNVQAARATLLGARNNARDQLQKVFGKEEKTLKAVSQLTFQLPHERSDYCLFVISLLQVGISLPKHLVFLTIVQMSHEMRQVC